MNLLLFSCIFISFLSLTSTQSNGDIESSYKQDISTRSSYPGLLQILRAALEVVESLVAYFTGKGTAEDIAKSVQGVFLEASRMISIQGLVGEIPMYGFILQPLVGIVNMILSHTPLLGGIISFILVGISPD